MRAIGRGTAYRFFCLFLAVGLTACGGGGGSGATSGQTAAPASTFPASSTLASICTVEAEQQFIRSYLDEKYLWYREIPNVDTSPQTAVTSYFKSLLVTTPDASGRPKDKFSFVISTTDADALSTGVNIGYGIEWVRDSQGRLRVAYIAPGSPAAEANMARGGHMVQVINYNVNSWYPNIAGAWVQFWYSDIPGGSQRLVNLDTRIVQEEAVAITRTLASASGKRAGYLLFNAHSRGAQDKLITATRSLQTSGIEELVLDMRYNSGGYLYVANTLAAMVSGPEANGKVFEALHFNDKRATDSADNVYRFTGAVDYAESVYPVGYPLPRLNLRRVYVLTSEDTCSASESVINSLRGVDIEVILVGRTTCGKPYGFTRKNNCALAYYPIEFQGTNHKGFGDYSAGLAPTCPGTDDLDHPLGQLQEGLLAAALYHVDHGSCAPVAAQKQAMPLHSAAALSPMLTERLSRGRWLQPGSP